jgi:alkylhydroperoxidase/carboxymuconolactone decarboxylase family protein YurZ
VEQLIGSTSPGLAQYTTEVLFRNLWLRPDLAPRDRSLLTVGALIATGQVAQLSAHLNSGDEQRPDASAGRRGHRALGVLRGVAERLLGRHGRAAR